MAAIADCAKAIKNLGNGNGAEEMRQLIQITERAMQSKIANATSTPITTGVPARSRVPLYINNETRQTISKTLQMSQMFQLSTPSLPRVGHQWASQYRYIRRQTREEHGHTTLLMDGTWRHHQNTTAHIDDT